MWLLSPVFPKTEETIFYLFMNEKQHQGQHFILYYLLWAELALQVTRTNQGEDPEIRPKKTKTKKKTPPYLQ